MCDRNETFIDNLLPTNLGLNKVNDFYARFDSFHFSKEIAAVSMALNECTSAGECLEITKEETAQSSLTLHVV